MRVTALVLGILGSLMLLMVGALWTDNAEHLKEVEEMAQTVQTVAKEAQAAGHPAAPDDTAKLNATLDAVRGKARASYPMALAGLVGFVASLFAIKFPKPSGAIMALAVLVPAGFYLGSLFASFLLGVAATFALLARSKAGKPAAAVAAAMLLAVVAAPARADQAPQLPDPAAIKANCSHAKTLSICVDYMGEAFAVLDQDFYKSGCTASNGTWAAGACPTDKTVAGACAMGSGKFQRYYAAGNIPYKADSAAKDCKDLQSGIWVGAR